MTLFGGSLMALACLSLLASPWPYLAPLMIFGVFGLIALFRRPAWGLLGLAALAPFEGVFRESLISGAKLLGASLILVLALQLLLRRLPETRFASNLWRPLGLFLFCMFLSTLFTENLLYSLNSWRELLIGMTLFGFALLVGRDVNMMALCRLIALSVAVTCLNAFLSTEYQEEGRAIGLLQDANYFALLIAVALPPAALLVLHAKKMIPRLFWGGVCLILLAGMIKTDSRSGLLVALLTCAIGAWQHRDRLRRARPRHLGIVMLGAAILAPLTLASLPEEYIERVKSLGMLKSSASARQDPSLGRRASYLLIGAEMIRDNPLLGSGPGNFPLRYERTGYAKLFADTIGQIDISRRAHNTYLEIFSEMGIPAGLFFVSLILLALRNFARARSLWAQKGEREKSDLVTHLGLSMLAMSLFLMFLSVPNHKYLWMLLALSSVLRARAEETPRKEERRANDRPANCAGGLLRESLVPSLPEKARR
ncbi:MAG: O-antigen ligase family protein [Zoogloeaceae bacterium]|jgi:O-antigen ligase|nr:O-antigen ligase family protein [Zoogloeaceae bacterium]